MDRRVAFKIKQIKKLGLKSSPPFQYIGLKGKDKFGHYLAEVENVLTKERKIRTLTQLVSRNPWGVRGKGKKQTFTEMKRELAPIIQDFNPPIKVLEDAGCNSSGSQLLKVQNLVTKETIVRTKNTLKYGYNPWGCRFKNFEVVQKSIHEYSLKSNPPFQVNQYLGSKKNKSMIEVENCITKEKMSYPTRYLMNNQINPWCDRRLPFKNLLKILIPIINKFDPKIKIKEYGESCKNKQAKVIIQNVKTKETMNYPVYQLKKGINPYSEEIKRIERSKIHPQIKKILNDLGIKFQYEPHLSDGSIPDFLIITETHVLIIEVKSDHRAHSPKLINSQTEKYLQALKVLYPHLKQEVTIVSSAGKVGMHINKLRSYLKKNKINN